MTPEDFANGERVVIGISPQIASLFTFSNYTLHGNFPREYLQPLHTFGNPSFASSLELYELYEVESDTLIIINEAIHDAFELLSSFSDDRYINDYASDNYLVFAIKFIRQQTLRKPPALPKLDNVEFDTEEEENKYCVIIAYFLKNMRNLCNYGISPNSIITRIIGGRHLMFLL